MPNNCGHETIEMNGPDGYCTRCGRVVGTYDSDGAGGEWTWFPGEDPSVYRVNLLAIQALNARKQDRP